MIRSEKMILRKTEEIDKWLSQATSIYNQALYYLRQEYFESKKQDRKPDYSKIDLYRLVKESDSWKTSDLDTNAKQYVLRKVKDNWKSFYRACKAYRKDKSKFLGMPKIPRYLKNGRSTILIFDKTRLRSKDPKTNTLRLPKSNYLIQLPKYIDMYSLKCITVKQYYGKVKLNISYNKTTELKQLNKNKYLGIDIGIDNIVAITTDNQTRKSWIVKGGNIKSINQFYNKRISNLKSILETVNNRKTSKKIQQINMKRNHQLDYEFHCLSKKIIQICLDNDIGNIVIGHNKNWKQESNLGRHTNQNFVQIPFNDLIFKLQYKGEENGINVELTEESYTSKTDHLVGEQMSKHDSYLGTREKRGLFKSSCGKILNADINGSIGIIRKKNVFSDVDLINLRDRGDVVSPTVLKYKP